MVATGAGAAELAEFAERARQLAEGAGRLLLDRQAGPRLLDYKDRHARDPVTDADRAAEEYLRTWLRQWYPTHAILGEEGETSEAGVGEWLWTLDPLDGTANYAARLSIFAVSVALLHRGVPVAGAIAVPAQGLVYYAWRGGGAYLGRRRLVACQHERLAPGAPVGLAAGWRESFVAHQQLKRRQGEPRALGSIAAELGLVADGGLQYAAYAAPRLWDVAAGALLVVEAGGLALTWQAAAGWQPVDRFSPAAGQASLRDWQRPTLVGGGRLLPAVAADLAPRPSLTLGRLLRRLTRPGG